MTTINNESTPLYIQIREYINSTNAKNKEFFRKLLNTVAYAEFADVRHIEVLIMKHCYNHLRNDTEYLKKYDLMSVFNFFYQYSNQSHFPEVFDWYEKYIRPFSETCFDICRRFMMLCRYNIAYSFALISNQSFNECVIINKFYPVISNDWFINSSIIKDKLNVSCFNNHLHSVNEYAITFADYPRIDENVSQNEEHENNCNGDKYLSFSVKCENTNIIITSFIYCLECKYIFDKQIKTLNLNEFNDIQFILLRDKLIKYSQYHYKPINVININDLQKLIIKDICNSTGLQDDQYTF